MKTMSVRYSDNPETRLTLERGQVASTKEARGLAVECVRGTVWITFEYGGVDHVLEPGERLPVNAGGRMVIEAIEPSEVVLFRQELAAEPVARPASHALGYTPECWRTMVGGMALPLTNFDSAF
jgi:Protein of unknown function (DUF2917)